MWDRGFERPEEGNSNHERISTETRNAVTVQSSFPQVGGSSVQLTDSERLRDQKQKGRQLQLWEAISAQERKSTERQSRGEPCPETNKQMCLDSESMDHRTESERLRREKLGSRR